MEKLKTIGKYIIWPLVALVFIIVAVFISLGLIEKRGDKKDDELEKKAEEAQKNNKLITDFYNDYVNRRNKFFKNK